MLSIKLIPTHGGDIEREREKERERERTTLHCEHLRVMGDSDQAQLNWVGKKKREKTKLKKKKVCWFISKMPFQK